MNTFNASLIISLFTMKCEDSRRDFFSFQFFKLGWQLLKPEFIIRVAMKFLIITARTNKKITLLFRAIVYILFVH